MPDPQIWTLYKILLARGFCVAGCCGGGHVKWCHEVAKPVLAATCNYICTDRFEIQAKRSYNDEEKSENGLRTSPYSLSHFVAPLYVAPSTTPSNATTHRRVFVCLLVCFVFTFSHDRRLALIWLLQGARQGGATTALEPRMVP